MSKKKTTYLQAIACILANHPHVTDITVERGFETKEVDGWAVNEPTGEVFFSFTYNENNKISLEELNAEDEEGADDHVEHPASS